jgi:type IV pilus assembly protein PilM
VAGTKTKSCSPIGLDLGQSAVKMVQLRRSSGKYTLSAHRHLDIPEELRDDGMARLNWLSKHIQKAMKSAGFSGKQCAIGLPPEDTFIRHIKIAKRDEDGTTAAVRQAATKELDYPVRDAVVRHIIVGEAYTEGETKQEVIVVATPKSTIDAYLHLADQLSLEATGLYIEPLALINCFSSLFDWGSDENQKTVLYVDMGAAHTQVVIAHEKEPAFIRSITRGARDVQSLLIEAMECSPEELSDLRQKMDQGVDPENIDQAYTHLTAWVESMCQEIETCIRYHNNVFRGGQTVSRVVFTGGAARDRRLCQALAKRLNLPAQIGDPMEALSVSKSLVNDGFTEQHPELSVAIGLCLSEFHN